MIPMDMVPFSFTGHKRTREQTSTWRVGSVDMKDIKFPSNDRIAELWRNTVKDGGELLVIDEEGSNHRAIEIPRGIKIL